MQTAEPTKYNDLHKPMNMSPKKAQNKIQKNITCKDSWGQIWPQRGKIEILEKRLSLTAQNNYADLEDTCRDKVMKFGVTERYIEKSYRKKAKAGVKFDPGWPFKG